MRAGRTRLSRGARRQRDDRERPRPPRLRRRGSARAFLEGAAPGHDPFLLGDMREACERIRAAIAAGKRICVHGDYDADGICATALAVLVLRELGADVRLAPAEPFRRGLRRAGRDDRRLADEGYGLVLTVDCGITAVDEVAEARAARPRGRRHRPSPAGRARCPTVPSSPRGRPTTRSRSSAGPASCYKLGQALLGADHPAAARAPRPRRARDDRRRRPARRREPGARDRGAAARWRATQKPGLQRADARRARRSRDGRRGRGRVPARAADQRRRAARPSRGRARAAADRGRATTARRLADELEELNRERQAVEDADRARGASAQVEAWPEAAARRRGYVVAGEEWHEGVIGIVASRLVERFHRPVVLIAGGERRLEGLRPLDPGVRPPRRRSPRAPAPRALRRPPRRRRPLDPPGADRRVRRGVRRPCRRGSSRDDDLAPVTRIDAVVPRPPTHARPLRGARPARARSGSATRT